MLRTLRHLGFLALAAVALAAGPITPTLAQAVTKTASYTAVGADCDPDGKRVIVMNVTGGGTLLLPQAGGSGQFIEGCRITVVNISASDLNITAVASASTISGLGSIQLSVRGSAVIYPTAAASGTGNYVAVYTKSPL